MKNVKYSDVDYSINGFNVEGFYDYGNVIEFSDIEIFEPDFTVDVHEILYDLKLIRGKKRGEELNDFLGNGKWWIHLKGSIKSLNSDDYDVIIKKAQELHDLEEKWLEILKTSLLKNNGEMNINNLDLYIFKSLGKPQWLLDSEGLFRNNAHQIMKTKLAKVGILYEPKEDFMEVVDLENGKYLAGDGNEYNCSGYMRVKETKELIRLSDIKEEILSGDIIVDDDNWLVYV